MRYIGVIAVSFFMSFSFVWAEDIVKFQNIEYHNFDFRAEVSDSGLVHTAWNSYGEDSGFLYYKLMYSTRYANPSYPELSARYTGNDVSESSKSFKISSGENHYFRICAITYEGDGIAGRYCSKTRKFIIDEETGKYIEEEDGYTIEDNSELSSDLKIKVQERLENFISKLESTGYTDLEIVSIISSVIEKLDSYSQDAKYRAVVIYLQDLLREYRAEYEDALHTWEEY